MGSVARQESDKKSERLRRQRDQHAQLGRAHGGVRRFGYLHTRDADGAANLEIVPEEAELVGEAAERFLGGESMRSIARDWNERGIPTVRNAQWRVTTLRTLLSGPHIAGLRVHRGAVVGEAQWQPIIDRATFELLRARIGDPRRRQGGRPPAHLLTGVLRCSFCDGRMTYSKRKRTSGGDRYSCNPPGGLPICGRVSIAAEPTEEIVVEAVLDVLSSPAMASALSARTTPDAGAVSQQIVSIEKAMDSLAVDFYSENKISRREYEAARSALDQKLTGLLADVPSSPPQASMPEGDIVAVRHLWEAADLIQRRAILAELIDKVLVLPASSRRRQVDPNRLEIRWNA